MPNIQHFILVLAFIASCKPSTLKKPKKFYEQDAIPGTGVRLTEENLWELAPKYDKTQLTSQGIYISSFEVGTYPLVFVSVPLMDIDFIKIKYCDIKTAICHDLVTSLPHTIIDIPNPGTYQVSVQTCLNKERSKTNLQICSQTSEPYSFHQTQIPDPSLGVLIAQSLETTEQYRSLGLKLYSSLEKFTEAMISCPDDPKPDFSERVRSFLLGGPEVLTDQLRNSEHTSLLHLTTDQSITTVTPSDPGPDSTLEQLIKDLKEKEKKIQDSAKKLWQEKSLSLSSEFPASKKTDEWQVLFGSAFEAASLRLSKEIFLNIESTARITSGIDSKRSAYLVETVEASKNIEGRLLEQKKPTSTSVEGLQSLLTLLKDLRTKFTKANWNHLGGYFELNWKSSREFLLAEEFDRSLPEMESFLEAAKNYMIFDSLNREITVLRSKQQLLEKQAEIQQEKAYTPIHTGVTKSTDQPDTIDTKKISELYSGILIDRSEPLSMLMRLRAIEMDIPEIPIQSNLSFRSRYFNLIYGKNHFLSIQNKTETSLLLGLLDYSPDTPNQAKGLNEWLPKTTFTTASENLINSIFGSHDPSGLLQIYKNAIGQPEFTSELTSLKSVYPEPRESGGSWLIKIDGNKFSHLFISELLASQWFLKPESTEPISSELIREADHPGRKILTKLLNWQGPALKKGISSLINPESESLYSLGSLPAYQLEMNNQPQFSECYQTGLTELKTQLQIASDQSNSLKSMERANYSLLVEYFSK